MNTAFFTPPFQRACAHCGQAAELRIEVGEVRPEERIRDVCQRCGVRADEGGHLVRAMRIAPQFRRGGPA